MQQKQSGKKSEASLEDQFSAENYVILRLPAQQASDVHELLGRTDGVELHNNLSICYDHDMRHARVKVNKKVLKGKFQLMDLPCVVESLKSVDKKNFYKVSNLSQMLVCTSDTENVSDKEAKDKEAINPKKESKQWLYPHGITPPMKNVRKRRFRKTLRKKYMDAPELEKELKRLLRSDLEAVNVEYEVLAEGEEPSQDKIAAMEAAENQPSASGMQQKSLRPPEFSNIPQEYQEADLFGRVSGSSSEDEGQAMAKKLLESWIEEDQHGSAGPSGSGEKTKESVSEPVGRKSKDVIRSEIFMLEAELDDLRRRRADFERQAVSIDNQVLKERMQIDITNMMKEEAEKREQLEQLKAEDH